MTTIVFLRLEKKRNLFHPSNEIQKAYGRIIVMADAAHALGANWHDQMVGNVADLTTFSFHAVKNFYNCRRWSFSMERARKTR